ncbi:MAG: lipopolysaccharide biosynthesis protein [Rubrivivax sp.]|nr:lipopolysaccharide biosynthesis protein [Rubrivivax sp.]
MSTGPQRLGERSLSAVFWGAGGTVVRLLLQVGAQVFLARLLGPEQYGIFAIGATVVSFSACLSDIGLAYGLIQKADVSARDVRFVFTWQVILGLLVTLGVWSGAGGIAAFFGELRARPVLEMLSVLCLLNALTAPSLNLLKRGLDFKRIQLSQIVSYVAGYIVVGIPMALAGWQVWALVTAWVVQAALNLLLLYVGTGHALRPLLWYEQARAQTGYGGAVLVTNLINWVIGNVDRVIVARSFGSHDVGLYATTYNLLYNPTAAALGVVQPVFFSASSRLGDDAGRVESGYLTLVGFVAAIVLPAFAIVAVMAEPLILLLYGPRWADAAQLCRPIALAMPCFMLFGLTTPMLWTAGRPASEFQIQLPLALVWLTLCLLAATVSVQAVAWCVLALALVRCALVMATAVRLRGMAWRPLWQGVRGGLGMGAVVVAAIAVVDQALQHLLVGPALRLLVAAVLAPLAWLLLAWCWPGLLSAALKQLLVRLGDRLPPRLRILFDFLRPHEG